MLFIFYILYKNVGETFVVCFLGKTGRNKLHSRNKSRSFVLFNISLNIISVERRMSIRTGNKNAEGNNSAVQETVKFILTKIEGRSCPKTCQIPCKAFIKARNKK